MCGSWGTPEVPEKPSSEDPTASNSIAPGPRHVVADKGSQVTNRDLSTEPLKSDPGVGRADADEPGSHAPRRPRGCFGPGGRRGLTGLSARRVNGAALSAATHQLTPCLTLRGEQLRMGKQLSHGPGATRRLPSSCFTVKLHSPPVGGSGEMEEPREAGGGRCPVRGLLLTQLRAAAGARAWSALTVQTRHLW